jgi:hypothetical protein
MVAMVTSVLKRLRPPSSDILAHLNSLGGRQPYPPHPLQNWSLRHEAAVHRNDRDAREHAKAHTYDVEKKEIGAGIDVHTRKLLPDIFRSKSDG